MYTWVGQLEPGLALSMTDAAGTSSVANTYDPVHLRSYTAVLLHHAARSLGDDSHSCWGLSHTAGDEAVRRRF